MSYSPSVLILVLNYRCLDNTIQCIQCIRKSDYSNYSILVIDNAPAKESEVLTCKQLKTERIIASGSNLGYAKGNNIGIRIALQEGYDFVLIVNPDSRIQRDTITALVETAISRKSIGCCGAAMRSKNSYLLSSRVYPRLGYHIRGKWSAMLPQNNYVRSTGYVEGCCLLIKCAMIREAGLLNETFFLYYEELEYSMRGGKLGWESVNCLRTYVEHEKGYLSKTQRYYMVESRLLLARIMRKHLYATYCLTFASVLRNAIVRRVNCFPFFIQGLRKPLQPIEKP